METKIRKCFNPKCANIIPVTERPNKKFCSENCKNKAHNQINKKGMLTWDKVLDAYDELPKEKVVPLQEFLKENYYPPRKIKNKK
jgi:hypothetical protein